ncbi:MAG: PIN domain-containing protein [Chloroflexi bacterium]|nr:PIN domain-containing protein [Chloroflexota bacterium]
MPEVFADTGYWIALLNERDSLHSQARELSAQLSESTIVTSEMVLTEFLNHASRGGSQLRRVAGESVLQWMADPNIEVVPQSSAQFQAALERYLSRLDQSWSVADCASFIVMETRQIQEALAFDRHFEQAGFTALLRNSE